MSADNVFVSWIAVTQVTIWHVPSSVRQKSDA